jgi:peptidoglycan/xylan/chitin deacetylase (PgdA/CDA1 family)
MRISILLLLLGSFLQTSHASIQEILQYPEDRIYTAADRGLAPYRSLSIYKTGKFSLTFDDGPHPTRTPRVLDVLKRHNVRATFFILTDLVNDSNFHIVKRILDEGHILASHGPVHDNSNTLTEEQWKQHMRRTIRDLARMHIRAGHPMPHIFYRYPYGAYGSREDYHHMNALLEVSRELTGDNCIQFAFWDVDTADWVNGMTSREVSQNIIAHNEGGTYIGFRSVQQNGRTVFVKNPMTLRNPPGGGVVLQHDIHEITPGATDLFLRYARERYLDIIRLDEVEEFRVKEGCQLI